MRKLLLKSLQNPLTSSVFLGSPQGLYVWLFGHLPHRGWCGCGQCGSMWVKLCYGCYGSTSARQQLNKQLRSELFGQLWPKFGTSVNFGTLTVPKFRSSAVGPRPNFGQLQVCCGLLPFVAQSLAHQPQSHQHNFQASMTKEVMCSDVFQPFFEVQTCLRDPERPKAW